MKQQPFGRQMQRIVGGTLHRTFSEARASCPKNRWSLWDRCKKLFGEHSKEPFGRRKPFAAKSPRRQTCHFSPRPLLWLKAPKLTLLGKKKLRNWETSWKKWWGNLPQNLLAPQNGSAPEDHKDHETCATLVKPWWNLGGALAEPWWNLPRKLLAAQDGSAPENHRESESNSAPKPLLWLKTPKLLLLGKKGKRKFWEKKRWLLKKMTLRINLQKNDLRIHMLQKKSNEDFKSHWVFWPLTETAFHEKNWLSSVSKENVVIFPVVGLNFAQHQNQGVWNDNFLVI